MRGMKPAAKPLGEVVELRASAVRIPPYPSTLPRGLPRECWDAVTQEMVAKNIYDEDCRDIVEAYCIQRARFLEANEHLIEAAQISKSKHGKPTHNPWISISNHAFDRMVRLASELGLSPVSRQRAVKIRGARSVAPAAKFLKT
jgi:P27 family predicted phage terminase small subunit